MFFRFRFRFRSFFAVASVAAAAAVHGRRDFFKTFRAAKKLCAPPKKIRALEKIVLT